MFDGVPEQYYQFIASRTSLPSTLPHHPLPYPTIHGSSSSNAFDIYPSHQLHPLQPQFLHLLDQPSHIHKQENTNLVSINMEIERPAERSISEAIWSNDEILALSKIGSTMENWHPDITWEHVSRKLEEMGFNRSAEKCKEKFDEESRFFNSISTYSKNCKLYGALEELCHGENTQHVAPEKHIEDGNNIGRDDSTNKSEDRSKIIKEHAKEKKRKREQKFERFKSFCEGIVYNMLAQQEDMHNRLIEDMVKREEEFIAKEEARNTEEMDRMNKEFEIIAQEQALASERQAKIAEYLNNITASNPDKHFSQWRNTKERKRTSTQAKLNTPSLSHANSTSQTTSNPNSQDHPPQNPTSPNIKHKSLAYTSSSSMKKDVQKSNKNETKRWPRDEVLALINLRCNVNTNNEDKGRTLKVPIWERISLGMLELGYKRSAKRCKEKWENINKYFRKTKDGNKKRCVESRTCPYFHQLSSLYNQGKLMVSSPENAEKNLVPEYSVDSCQGGTNDEQTAMHVVQGEKNMVQLPGFDFEF